MRRAGPRGLKIAPLRRRSAAACIDLVVSVSPVVAVVAAAVAIAERVARRRGREVHVPPLFTVPARWQAVLWTLSIPAGIATRNWRGLGYRVLGLRRVDVRTGGPLTVRNSLVHQAVGFLFTRVSRRLARPWRDRSRRLWLELEQIRKAQAGDQDAQRRATREFLEQHKVKPLGACFPLLVVAGATRAPALWSPLNQTLAERLAAIVVVQD